MKDRLNFSANNLAEAISFRVPLQVQAVYVFSNSQGGNTAYPVCPRCQISMEREYQPFCDRCGQALGWENYESAFFVYR